MKSLDKVATFLLSIEWVPFLNKKSEEGMGKKRQVEYVEQSRESSSSYKSKPLNGICFPITVLYERFDEFSLFIFPQCYFENCGEGEGK